MSPVAWAGFVAADTVGAATVFGVVAAAEVGDDETVLDDDVDGREEVAGPLDAGPQLDRCQGAEERSSPHPSFGRLPT